MPSIFEEDYNEQVAASKLNRQLITQIEPAKDLEQPFVLQAGEMRGFTRTRGDEGIKLTGNKSRLDAGRGYSGGTVSTDGSVSRW
jgi:hypothetical protein